MTTLTKALLALVIALGIGVGVQTWRVKNAQRSGVEAALAPAKEAAASAAAKVETVTVQLAAAERVVTRTINLIRVDTLLIHPQTAQDTAKALVQLPALAAQHDTLQRACTELRDSCLAYRVAAVEKFRTDSVVIAKQAAIIDSRPLPKHWRFGVTGGYGALLSGDQVRTGPTVSVGMTWTPFN